jgi:glycosyltransferase involved in cell wall biosynthesis
MSGGAPSVAAVLPLKEGFTPTTAGAVALVLRDILRATADAWDTTVIGRAPPGAPFAPCRYVAAPPSPLWRRVVGVNRAYGLSVRRALRRDPAQLVEVHNRPSLALSLAAALAPVPVSLVIHNDPHGMRACRTPAERTTLLRRLGAVVCISAWVRGKVLEGVADSALHAKAVVIPNGIDLGAAPAQPAEREKLILFVGRITRDKGFDSFVRACAIALPALPGWRAAAIGADRFRADSPETSFIREMRPQAEAAGIRMLGFQDNPSTLGILARAAILVMPSRWQEAFGRVAQEAHMVGAALITTRRGGLPEAAGEAALYIDPDDPADIAAAIRRLAEDGALAESLRQAGRQHVSAFGLPETAARWSALRRSLLA